MLNILDGVLIVFKTLFIIILTAFILLLGYLAYTNPMLNHKIKLSETNQNINKEVLDGLETELKYQEYKQWRYDYFSDVAANEDKYPIVVLRTGYKALKIKDESALIGWIYEIVNTSPNTRYDVTVNFKLTDKDDFEIGSSTEMSFIQAGSYKKITDTIYIDHEDLSRLSGSSWTISLTPSWDFNESDTSGSRYERLKKIINDVRPSWFYSERETIKSLAEFGSDKWLAITKGMNIGIENKFNTTEELFQQEEQQGTSEGIDQSK